jgi:lysozyme
MRTSQNGIAVLKHFESCSLTAYPDPGSGGAPWTIGWGHTGPEVVPGLSWTQDQAAEQLVTDLAVREKTISSSVTAQITQGQFDALVSFLYNVGPGKAGAKDGLLMLKNGNPSSLLRLTNAGDVAGADEQFQFWNKASGVPMRGLTRRRAAEAALFTGSNGADAIATGVAAA